MDPDGSLPPDLQARARRCVKLAAQLTKRPNLKAWLLDDARGAFERQAAALLQHEKIVPLLAQISEEAADQLIAGELFMSGARALIEDAERRRKVG